MMSRPVTKLLSLALAGTLALSVSAGAPMAKDRKRNDDAAAVAGIIALGVLGAALADHQHRRGKPSYEPHPAYHPSENAVGACVHQAKIIAANQGAYRLQINQIDRVKQRDDGAMRVVFHATGYYPAGARTSKVRCVVYADTILDFDYT